MTGRGEKKNERKGKMTMTGQITGKETEGKERGNGKDSKEKRGDECYFPSKNIIKGKGCGEDSKILALRELVRC